MTASKVCVAVRVRPLGSSEVALGGSHVVAAQPSRHEVQLGSRRFTYDQVFDTKTTQNELYESVSKPLRSSFLEGYNATIMAYGQTGSGKTFTMGSEAHSELDINMNTGLIPRFMNDICNSLHQKTDSQQLSSYKLEASFLEVYGEDVHDLLLESRPSLPLREDANGGIVCPGLTMRPVHTAGEALQVLNEGTMNRTTAATLMNLTSSRSHAVFTVTLTQTSQVEGVEMTTMSRFTFVDLAGSERMKKTGAEGERAREGIKINEGLLALGNVINALADEGRLAEGKQVHVPYRQSKLTRLLQDALGGNSQTLFLACVSPSDTNANETLSTLRYANRARNIKNAPTKNVDANALELQRLQAYNSLLQCELVRARFGGSQGANEAIGKPCDDLMVRPEVNEYLSQVHELAMGKVGSNSMPAVKSFALTSPRPKERSRLAHSPMVVKPTPIFSGMTGGTENRDPEILTEMNPDEDMAILNQLLELQQKEHEFDENKKKDDEELEAVNGQLAEEESLLLQLRESLKAYHNMKEQYEKVMLEVQQLEAEKTQLAEQLEKAKSDPSKGCKVTITKNLEKVERNLARARSETQKQRELVRKAEREAQRCQALERKVSDLKNRSATLIRKQKEAATQHREYTEQKRREITALKRKERVTDKKMSKLQSELRIHQKNLDKRQAFCNKLSSKLKDTEAHLKKLLAIRQREHRERTGKRTKNKKPSASSSTMSPEEEKESLVDSEAVKAIQLELDRIRQENVNRKCAQQRYQEKFNLYSGTMRSVMEVIQELDDLKEGGNGSPMHIEELEQRLESLEVQVELMEPELEQLSAQVPEADDADTDDPKADVAHRVSFIVKEQTSATLGQLLASHLESMIALEVDNKSKEILNKRKESVIESLEGEVSTLSKRIHSMKRGTMVASAMRVEETYKQQQDIQDKMTVEIAELKENLEGKESLEKENRSLKNQLSMALEKVALVEAALSQTNISDLPEKTLAEMQHIWEKLGAEMQKRDVSREKIANCLQDTCARLLQEASDELDRVMKSVSTKTMDMAAMYGSLGEDVPMVPEDTPALPLLEETERNIEKIQSWYDSAVRRRDEIAEQASQLAAELEMGIHELQRDLQTVLKETKEAAVIQSIMPCNLSENFLSNCENQLRSLRVEKSKRHARISLLYTESRQFVADLNFSDDEIVFAVQWYHENGPKELPAWWKIEEARTVVRLLVAENTFSRQSPTFSKHLSVINEVLGAIVADRKLFASRIKDLVQRCQTTLLDIVDGSLDAKEAYASFHDALFRLPELSKEFINACISESEALLSGVEAMVQSEIEALTVVWEALDVSSSKRGKFWDALQKSLDEIESTIDVGKDLSNSEAWIAGVVEASSNVLVNLEKRLLKLRQIHTEVERLSARQDAKSRILSLDSEIRILNARLAEFEEEKCDKERLVSKKSNSSYLLKEERYRKQMQSKFASKFAQLGEVLKMWCKDEGGSFDPTLLSDEVRKLLANSEKIDFLVEKRTEFMHLRTVRSKSNPKNKREPETPTPNEQPTKRLTRAAARAAAAAKVARAESIVIAQSTTKRLKRKVEEVTSVPVMERLTRETSSSVMKRKKVPSGITDKRPRRGRAPFSPTFDNKQKKPLSPKSANVGLQQGSGTSPKKLTLPPFGHVLQKAFSPRSKSKENFSF